MRFTITEGPTVPSAPKGAGLGQFPALTAMDTSSSSCSRRGNGQSFGIRRGYNDRTEAGDAYEYPVVGLPIVVERSSRRVRVLEHGRCSHACFEPPAATPARGFRGFLLE